MLQVAQQLEAIPGLVALALADSGGLMQAIAQEAPALAARLTSLAYTLLQVGGGQLAQRNKATSCTCHPSGPLLLMDLVSGGGAETVHAQPAMSGSHACSFIVYLHIPRWLHLTVLQAPARAGPALCVLLGSFTSLTSLDLGVARIKVGMDGV
jgi:hypothetical protein